MSQLQSGTPLPVSNNIHLAVATDVSRVSDPPSNETSTGIITPKSLRADYVALDGQLQTSASLAKQAIDAYLPLLDEMQKLLSQRGSNKLLYSAAKLPTWSEYYADLRLKFPDLPTMRTTQRKLAALSGKVTQRKAKPAPSSESQSIKTAPAADENGERLLVKMNNLLDEIDKMQEKFPAAFLSIAKEVREMLRNGLPSIPSKKKAKPKISKEERDAENWKRDAGTLIPVEIPLT